MQTFDALYDSVRGRLFSSWRLHAVHQSPYSLNNNDACYLFNFEYEDKDVCFEYRGNKPLTQKDAFKAFTVTAQSYERSRDDKGQSPVPRCYCIAKQLLKLVGRQVYDSLMKCDI